MKKLLFICAISIQFNVLAQQAGTIGELLRNEATPAEMRIEHKEGAFLGQNFKNYNRNRNNMYPNYRWNQSYGYTEIFLRIPEEGYFTVMVGDQMMSNASGKFRFFDVSAGRVPLSIYQSGYLIYRTQVRAENNTRTVLDFFTNLGLYLLSVYPVGNQQYGIDDWNDIWNNPYQMPMNNGYGVHPAVMPENQFKQFVETIENTEHFDSDKAEFIIQQTQSTAFTSKQIKVLLSLFLSDDKRLNVGKKLYNCCVDKSNFFIVYDTFTFNSNRKDLMRYVSKNGY